MHLSAHSPLLIEQGLITKIFRRRKGKSEPRQLGPIFSYPSLHRQETLSNFRYAFGSVQRQDLVPGPVELPAKLEIVATELHKDGERVYLQMCSQPPLLKPQRLIAKEM